MRGEVGILNVGAGDTKLVFDKNNPQECVRAARIVRDMLRRGYALLVEVDGRMVRATDFREDSCEYVIADFDPVAAQKHDEAEEDMREESAKESLAAGSPAAAEATTGTKARGRGAAAGRRIRASETRAVAVARTAGG